ncbi:MAG: Cof-type HAD-IIB family hydrolase [Phycisphaerae bacterium]|nr:Cof-type HAD-IIB family hydrolase [Phycisphaerae bacterium]
MTKYKLLALDIDGTLIGRDEVVSPAVREAVGAAAAAGLKICLATGRSYVEAAPVWRQLPLSEPHEPMVLFGGALVSEVATARSLYHKTMPPDVARELSGTLSDAGFCSVVAVDPWRHGVDYFRSAGGWGHEFLHRWLGRHELTVRVSPRVDAVRDLPPALRVSAVVEPAKAPPLEAALRERFDGRLTLHTIYVPAYDFTVLEAFASGASKLAGVTYVGQPWQIGPGLVVAVGDDVNDVAMLRGAGLGVAMPQATDTVKSAARHVADQGLATFIHELLDGRFG